MHVIQSDAGSTTRPSTVHRWVGAALVGLGEGASRRAEHGARTGRHVLPVATKVDVLEVYCGRCRVRYSNLANLAPCSAVTSRAS